MGFLAFLAACAAVGFLCWLWKKPPSGSFLSDQSAFREEYGYMEGYGYKTDPFSCPESAPKSGDETGLANPGQKTPGQPIDARPRLSLVHSNQAAYVGPTRRSRASLRVVRGHSGSHLRLVHSNRAAYVGPTRRSRATLKLVKG